MIIRATLAAAAFVSVAGLALAAPVSAEPASPFDITCDDGSHGPCYTTDGPVYTDTIHNYLVFVPKTFNNYANFPSDTVNGYRDAVVETIKQYTGIDISGPATDTGESPLTSFTGGPASGIGSGLGSLGGG